MDDFVKTWDEYYEAANLRETYKFLASSSSSSSSSYSSSSSISLPANGYSTPLGRIGAASEQNNSSYTRFKRSPVWKPLGSQAEHSYTFPDQSQDRSYSSSQASMLELLTVDTLPPVMEFRVCEFTTKLKSSLSCVFDSSLAESRVLEECIDNIMAVSTVRLDVTQKIIDIKRELEDLENKESHYGI